jgi:tellurite resistance protein/uncharacterized protein (DUF697 family)
MTEDSAQALVTIAAITAMADGTTDAQERAELERVAAQMGVSLNDVHVSDDGSAAMEASRIARRFTTQDEREAAYRVALAVAHADGYVNTKETLYLRALAQALGVDARVLDAEAGDASRGVEAWASELRSEGTSGAATAGAAAAAGSTASASGGGSMDDFILDQAMLTAALELLPDKLANLGIIPLQLRLVHTIGQRSGGSGESLHVKELMATLGLSVMGQALETAVRKTFGGLAGGLLGRMLGGAGGVAAGAAVTFASTYALGHVAQQYYAQGRTMSASDLKTLFGRLKDEGGTMYPRVQQRIGELARGNTLSSVMQSLRPGMP